MRRFLTALAAIVALSACATAATEQGAGSQHSTALNVTPLQYHYRQLANGLRVYAMPDPGTANVSVQVWYDVGSKDDPVGRSGFAHLFEHIMFKATRNMPDEFMDRLTEDVGGYNNASTYDDFTNYYEVVPANHLQRLLWAEAERMGSLVIDEATFDSERDVVKEELRQRVLASPYGRLFYLYLPRANYSVHPYGRPGIGSIEDLDAATVADVRAFHAQYYRPDNAVLVVSGNFDETQFNQWVDEYFGPIARPDRPIPRVTAQEPVRTAPRAYTVHEPNVPLPAIMISYPLFDARNEDMAALMVLDGILSTGDSSRMYQAMVYREQVAAQVFTNFEATRDPSAYSLFAILSEGQSAEAGLASLMNVIAGVRDRASRAILPCRAAASISPPLRRENNPARERAPAPRAPLRRRRTATPDRRSVDTSRVPCRRSARRRPDAPRRLRRRSRARDPAARVPGRVRAGPRGSSRRSGRSTHRRFHR